MAISFARLTVHTRSKGHSAVAASAYRSGSILYDERYGETHDFRNKKEVGHSEILLPEGSHEKLLDRETLWNLAESSERRKDAQVAKDLTIALPKELNLEQQILLARGFAKRIFVDQGLAVDFAIHDKGDGNPHAHLLVTMRKVEYSSFAIKKARDQNPVFYGRNQKKVFDLWGERWGDYQNEFFRQHNIDLTVDANYLMPTKHQGMLRNPNEPHYVKDQNNLRQEVSYDLIKKSPDRVLEFLTDKYATFTEKDISIFIFKNTKTSADYESVLLKVMASKELLILGKGIDGNKRYTTRLSYEKEQQLVSKSIAMSARKGKTISVKTINKTSDKHGLLPEQKEAVKYLVQQGDMACLVGRAGTGKTYTMKAVHELYKDKGLPIYGAALSGVAAKALERETGIKSDTIYSLSKRIEKNRFQPKSGSVIVIDEAGMVSLKDMLTIVKFAKKTHCKVVLLGDPDQLQPILAGAPFRAIMDHVGFVEMQSIKRQKHSQDRLASINLAKGRVGSAVDHYAKAGRLKFYSDDLVKSQLIKSWEKTLNEGLDKQLILAHTKAQVSVLNQKARTVLLEKGLLDIKAYQYKTEMGQVELSKNDRIIFLRNNYDLGVCNGDFGDVLNVSKNEIKVMVGKKELKFDPRKYRDFNYGYAVTIHKSQGATFNRVYTLLEGYGWDRHLSYVAMTRHKESLNVFVNRSQFKDLAYCKKVISKTPIRDNAIDYPLSFAMRRGFDSEKIVGQVIDRLAGVGHKIRDRWLYITNYQRWVLDHKYRERLLGAKQFRQEAGNVARFIDVGKTIRSIRLNRHSSDRQKDILPELIKEKQALGDLVNSSLVGDRVPAVYRQLIINGDWQKLVRSNNKGLVKNIETLTKVRNELLDSLDSKEVSMRLLKPFSSMIEKIMASKSQRAEVKSLAPNLYSQLKRKQGLLLRIGRKNGLERERRS